METRHWTVAYIVAVDTRSIFSLTDTQLQDGAHLAQNLPKSYTDNLGIFFKNGLLWPCTLPLAFSSGTRNQYKDDECTQSTSVADPGCLSRIRFFPSRIRIK